MSKKMIKYIFELFYIFIIPLLLIVLTSDLEFTNEYVYDSEGNFSTSEEVKKLTFDNSIIKYIHDDTYVNYLDFNQLFTYDRNYSPQLSVSVENNIVTLEVLTVDSYSYLGWDIGTFNQNDKILLNINNYDSSNSNFYIAWNPNYHHFDTPTIVTGQFSLFIDWRSCSVGDTLSFSLNIINLTQMYGSGYEPTIQEYKELFPLDYYDYTLSEEVVIYSDDIISSNSRINYTVWGRMKNSFESALDLNDSVVLDIIFCYIISWFIMFLTWHIFYLLFDKLFHLRRE